MNAAAAAIELLTAAAGAGEDAEPSRGGGGGMSPSPLRITRRRDAGGADTMFDEGAPISNPSPAHTPPFRPRVTRVVLRRRDRSVEMMATLRRRRTDSAVDMIGGGSVAAMEGGIPKCIMCDCDWYCRSSASELRTQTQAARKRAEAVCVECTKVVSARDARSVSVEKGGGVGEEPWMENTPTSGGVFVRSVDEGRTERGRGNGSTSGVVPKATSDSTSSKSVRVSMARCMSVRARQRRLAGHGMRRAKQRSSAAFVRTSAASRSAAASAEAEVVSPPAAVVVSLLILVHGATSWTPTRLLPKLPNDVTCCSGSGGTMVAPPPSTTAAPGLLVDKRDAL